MKKPTLFAALLFCASSSQAALFYSISSIESNTLNDLAPASNLIQGAGVAFDANEPHDQIATNIFSDLWVTAADAGFPWDYIDQVGMPVLTIDLGMDVPLSEISVWGYSDTNANGVAEFSLRFATEADTDTGFGNSIGFNPTYLPTIDPIPRQSFAFGQTVSARYVEFTVIDNFFVAPGDGSTGALPGGDRVGLGEIAFARASAIPEPGSVALFGLGLAGFGLARRKQA